MSGPQPVKDKNVYSNSAAIAIEQAFLEKTTGSARLAGEAAALFPSGVTHDSRYLRPHGLYIAHAEGAYKWDVDGNRYVDYFGGHGALLLGHGHPRLRAAIQAAVAHGTHFAAGHDAEIRWAEQVCRLVPSADRVRFTSSGTEAVMMALRLARRFTGKNKFLRFKGHFHGWADDMTSGFGAQVEGGQAVGVPGDVAGRSLLLEAGDLAETERVLAEESDLAAVILEPLGASTGMVPIDHEYLQALRELTAARGVVLILDEVITGFRISPGGAQAVLGICPDLTTLAKILAGGLPGGAVAGRKDILDGLDFEASRRSGEEKIYHPGTFNANPISAAAGAAMLAELAATGACEGAATTASHLRRRLNQILAEEGVSWAVYGQSSVFHFFLNPENRAIAAETFVPESVTPEELNWKPAELLRQLRLAMLVEGVDLSGWPGGLVSAAHDEDSAEETCQAFAKALHRLKQANWI